MVVAYLRVSTGKQNLANQQDEIRRFAAAGGIVVDRWVTEVVSGRKNEKERKLGPLLGKMRSGDTLIVTELSRLSRTLTDIMAIMGRCLERRIVLYSIKEGYAFDDSINSKVLCFAFGLAAEIERNLISMRTKEALALCRAEGVKLGRRKGSYTKLRILIDNRREIVRMLRGRKTIADVCRRYEGFPGNVQRTTEAVRFGRPRSRVAPKVRIDFWKFPFGGGHNVINSRFL